MCIGCGSPGALRRCTKQPLCVLCRQKPEFQVIRRKEALSSGLPERSLPTPMFASNRVDPRFAPEEVYWWSEIAQLCAERSLKLP